MIPDFCSMYCKLYDEQDLKPIPMGDSKHHKNHTKLPPIPRRCDYCKKEFELIYTNKKANATFCSAICCRETIKGRKAWFNYQLLRVLRDIGPSTSKDISKILSNWDKQLGGNMTPRRIGGSLAIWTRRGVVFKQGNYGAIYSLVEPYNKLPLGRVVQDYRSGNYET